MQIVIKVPDNSVDVKWLYEQLECLQRIGEVIPEGGHGHTPINIYDDCAEGYGTPDAFLLVTDEAYSDEGFNIQRRVIFHTDGTAYDDPFQEISDADYAGGGRRHEEGHVKNWTKGTWADGLLALAESVTGRLNIMDAQKGIQVGEALQNLVAVIGDTKAEDPYTVTCLE